MSEGIEKGKVSFNGYMMTCLGLYLTSLPLSIAGMEFFSTLFGVTFLILLARDGFLGRFEKVKGVFRNPLLLVGLCFFGVSGFSAWISPFRQTSFWPLLDINRNIVLLMGVFYLNPSPQLFSKKKFLSFFFGVLILVAFYTFFQFFSGVDLVRSHSRLLEPMIGGVFRAIGFFSLPLTYAYSLGMLFFFILPLVLSRHLRPYGATFKVLLLGALATLPLSIFATGVRGAWLSFACVSFLFLLMARNLKVWGLALVFGLIFSAGIFQLPGLRWRAVSIGDLTQGSNASRLHIWRANLEILKDHPWLGVGPNQSDFLVGSYYKKLELESPPSLPPNHHAHNDLLQVAAGSGFVGLIAYLALAFTMLGAALRSWWLLPDDKDLLKFASLGSFLGQLFFHVGGLTQCNYIDREVNHLLLFLWAFTLLVSVRFEAFVPKKLLDAESVKSY